MTEVRRAVPRQHRPDVIKQLLRDSSVRNHHRMWMVEQMARNGRWGTCGACPRVDGMPLPEDCAYTDRSDHWLDTDYPKDAP